MSLKRLVDAIQVLALVAVLAFVVMLFANGSGTATYSSQGAQLFSQNCARCHGADGTGGTGPRLAGVVAKKYPNINDQINVVTNGKPGMPSFKGTLTPAEIRAVVTYTRTGLGK